MTVYCGYLLLLSLALWVELAAGRELSKDVMTRDPEMRSIIEDLGDALLNYSSSLREMNSLQNLPIQPCTETTAHLGQSSTLVLRLSQYQVCAERLRPFCPDVCDVVTLNQDLLQHLKGSHQRSTWCPAPPSTSCRPPSDFVFMSESIHCVHCWSQQVAALRGNTRTHL